MVGRERLARAAERVTALAASYQPPDFAEAPDADAALFLCAIDHGTGYRGRHVVDGTGPHGGSALLWALGLRAERRDPGLLSAARLIAVHGDEVAEMLRIGGESARGPDVRARLWRDLAARLTEDYDGSAAELLAAAAGRLGGEGGLLERLAAAEAYSDPLAKKSFLFAKIAERRGWLTVSDPERWEVCADSVLMRLALRGGLVAPGPVEEVRAATRAALRDLAEEAGTSPPLLDDLLWERGREDPDLLGTEGGDVWEPPRPEGTHYY